MKKFAVIFLLLSVIQCKKADLLAPTGTTIQGNWELRRSEGGFAGTIKYAVGNGNIIKFINESQYSMVSNSSINDYGKYLLTPVSQGVWELQLKSATTSVVNIIKVQFTNSTMIWPAAESCCDIPTLTYARL